MSVNGFGACGQRIMAIRRDMIRAGVPVDCITRETMEAQINDLIDIGECEGETLWEFDDAITTEALDCIFAKA